MWFTRNDLTGAITVDEWDSETMFDYYVGLPDKFVLDQADNKVLRREGDDIYFDIANGFAHYRITEHQPERGCCKAVLVTGGIGDALAGKGIA